MHQKNIQFIDAAVPRRQQGSITNYIMNIDQVSRTGNELTSPVDSFIKSQGQISPDLILRKGIYDKVAASVILQ